MPRTIESGFSDFLTKLTPSATESQAAKTHRASIEACLKNNFGLIRFARIGSFGNGTSISGYSDVDYLACLPTDQLAQQSDSSLTKVRNALELRFPHTGVRVSCPTVVVPFGNSKSETTEIVPADLVQKSNYDIYDIADCAGGWMKASPDAHNAYVRWVDDKHGGQVKPLIRYVKAWKCYRQVPIASFYLELFVSVYAANETSIIYAYDVSSILARILNTGLTALPDPMKVSGGIQPCKSSANHQEAIGKLQNACSKASKACEELGKGNTLRAFEQFRLLYGENFPSFYY